MHLILAASDCETNENWDYSKWLEETSNKYNTLQCASDISNDNNELPCLESTTLIPKQEIQGIVTMKQTGKTFYEISTN